jgi:hypothetical protein
MAHVGSYTLVFSLNISQAGYTEVKARWNTGGVQYYEETFSKEEVDNMIARLVALRSLMDVAEERLGVNVKK